MLTRDDLLALREDSDFEVKAAQGRDGRGELPQSVWETYSALANTGGGRILLGAKERKDGSLILQGIADVQRVRKALWDGVNNRQVVSHNLLGNDDVEVLSVEDAEYPLILVSVPGATRKQRPVYTGVNPLTGTYRRNYEGDYRCDTETVRRMLAEAERDTRDSEILKGFGLDDLDPDSLSTFRNLFSATKPGHPWLALEDRELLRRLGGWARDREQNVEGPTLAGLLMFGQLHTIREVLPNFILDYQE
ncbi:MAG TPA: RNA-binding domain-containing protein, partial [Longimicrobium sp.]